MPPISHWLAVPVARTGLFRVPLPPPELAPAIGAGDFYAIGRDMVALLGQLAGVRSDERILDVGCGFGRLVEPLRRRLGARGSYEGIDIIRAFVDWDREKITKRDARFRFHHLDLFNTEYNPNGKLDPATVRLPFPDGEFSLVIATSLFTHLQADAVANYLREISRLLRPGGRLFATFFLLDDAVEKKIAEGATDIAFVHPIANGRVADPKVPEKAIAFDTSWVLAEVAATGLTPAAERTRGGWSGLPGCVTYQDVIVAAKDDGRRFAG